MRLTHFTDYALRALIYMACKPEKLSTVREISEVFDISYNHMVKVTHSLSKHGYINAQKGKGGGISLARPAPDINVGDVVCTLEPDLELVECFQSGGACCITPVCGLKHVFADARKAFTNELDKYSLADITKNRFELLSHL